MFGVLGAKLVLYPAACPASDMECIQMIGRVRAMENHLFVCYINHSNYEPVSHAYVPSTAAADSDDDGVPSDGSDARATHSAATLRPRTAEAEPFSPLDCAFFPERIHFPGGTFIASPDGKLLAVTSSPADEPQVRPAAFDGVNARAPSTPVIDCRCASFVVTDQVVLATVNPDDEQLKRWEARNPYLADRRPELYGDLVSIRGKK